MNLSENSILPITVGRRNWMLCDSTDGADASMMVYFLLETAKSNGLNPQKYLEYLLEARPDKIFLSRNLKGGRHGILQSRNVVSINHKVLRIRGISQFFKQNTPLLSAYNYIREKSRDR